MLHQLVFQDPVDHINVLANVRCGPAPALCCSIKVVQARSERSKTRYRRSCENWRVGRLSYRISASNFKPDTDPDLRRAGCLLQISDVEGTLVRTFLSPAHMRAASMVRRTGC